MKLEGAIVVFKQLETQREKNLLLIWRNKDRIRQNMYNAHVISPEEHTQWLDTISGDQTREYFVAYDKESDTPIGLACLYNIDREASRAEWAFYIGEDDYLKKGHAIEMECLILRYVFEDLGIHRLSCEVLDFNTQVISFHKKFGFVEEGRYREFVKREGKWVDSVLLSILEGEYRSNKERILKFVDRLSRGIASG